MKRVQLNHQPTRAILLQTLSQMGPSSPTLQTKLVNTGKHHSKVVNSGSGKSES